MFLIRFLENTLYVSWVFQYASNTEIAHISAQPIEKFFKSNNVQSILRTDLSSM